MKLTKEQIEQIKKLRKEGVTIISLSRMFNVTYATIYWHVSDSFKEKRREYRRSYRKNNKEYYKGQREYQRVYHKKRYNSDEDFRKKQIERSSFNQKLKGGIKK